MNLKPFALAGLALAALGAEPPTDRPPPLSPAEAEKHFKVPDGLTIRLSLSEPEVAQPLSISFDDRGRMWVLQYIQYPLPAGLKAVEMDQYLRTRYDRVPEPPPKAPKGRDRISVYEDADGSGRFRLVKHFVTDLNLASGFALGHGGVFVVQPPYLLFYPDRDRDDVPDGDPEVLLKGFGMDDAHAFANSLTWGPDGWLYGCQGSTVTANIRGVEFQQGVWRYHPATREFELFAEGGGNSWGIEFDRFGNLFAFGNTVEWLVHHVQGSYHVKGFGKHGPLHNPHAYGYFLGSPHEGFAGDSLKGGAVIYQGGAFPERFNGAMIAPNGRHSAARWSTIAPHGSSFASRFAGDFITTDDVWFRPVDMAVGPDGALYVADWYDHNISHSNPKNHSQWYVPSRDDGRVWCVAPPGLKTVRRGTLDLSKRSSKELVELLNDRNDWYARAARRLLGERKDTSVIPPLRKVLATSQDQRLALQALWSIHAVGGLSEEQAQAALASPHEYVRAWTVRLLGDRREVSPRLLPRLVDMARQDPSVIVRAQLACTAKRLPAAAALAILGELVRHDEDVRDPYVPLLLWWALESKSVAGMPGVLRLFEDRETWRRALAREYLIERLARRYAAEGSDGGYAAWARLLSLAPAADDRDRVIAGAAQAFAGRRLDRVPDALAAPVTRLLSECADDPRVAELALRVGHAEALGRVLRLVGDVKFKEPARVDLIRALGETRRREAVAPLLRLLDPKEPAGVQEAAVAALGYFDDPVIAPALLKSYAKAPAGVQAALIQQLCARPKSAALLVEAVERGAVNPAAVSLAQVRQVLAFGDKRIEALATKHWGRVSPATAFEKQGRITAVLQMLARAPGDAARGRAVFDNVCARCHKLHGQGAASAPDLTGAERKDASKLVPNVVDPSAVIREGYVTFVAETRDGRQLTGLLAEQTPQTVTLLDAENRRTVVNRSDLESLKESPQSIMPEELLDPLTDQQIRDLFAYLKSDAPPAAPAAPPALPGTRPLTRSGDRSPHSENRISGPYLISHTSAVQSALPEASRLPSGLKARLVTAPRWPLNSRSCLPLATSQTMILGVAPPAAPAMRLPSGEKVNGKNTGSPSSRRTTRPVTVSRSSTPLIWGPRTAKCRPSGDGIMFVFCATSGFKSPRSQRKSSLPVLPSKPATLPSCAVRIRPSGSSHGYSQLLSVVLTSNSAICFPDLVS